MYLTGVKMKKYLMIFFINCNFFSIGSVYAYTCTTNTTSTNLTSPNITIQRDLPVGSAIGSFIQTSNITAFNCSNTPAPAITYSEFGVKAYTNYVTTINGRRIYSTSIPGIGYAVRGSFCSANLFVDGSGTGDGNANNKIVCALNGVSNDTYGSLGIQLYKTAATTGTGTSTRQQVGSLVLRLNQSAWQNPEAAVYLQPFTVTSLACTVNTTSLNIAMGSIDKKLFSGVGTYPGDSNTKNVNLVLNCNSGTNVNLLVQGTTVNAKSGVLKLTSSAGAASGVGIQILNGATPLALNETVAIKTNTSAGTYTIPLKARYYQTESSIIAGTANSTATFTLTYK